LGGFAVALPEIPARDARVRIVRQHSCAASMLCENTSQYFAADSNIELPSY
jgi:hypothetical protein